MWLNTVYRLPVAALLAGCLSVWPAAGSSAAEPPAKKLIEWGWDEPETQFMRANIERMEKLPFDGLVFHVQTKQGDNLAWKIWGNRRFNAEDVQHAIDDLRATKFHRFTERFLRVNVCPGNVDWFDDDAWSKIRDNFALAAHVAKQGGCRGFMFDVEQYEQPPFDYRRQPHRPGTSFTDYQAKVRQRGVEWMRAVKKSFPEIKILLTFSYAQAQPRAGEKDRSESSYGLLADFLDGMVEACPREAKIVDAWEPAYPYKQRAQFDDAYHTIKEKAAGWSASPAKYRACVQAGFGIWMDYDWRKHGWSVDDFSKNHFTPSQFEASVRSALAVSDEYAWIYTEQPRWWTNERLPKEYVEALRRAKDGVGMGTAAAK